MREIKIYCNGCHKDITAKKSYRISLQVMKQEPIKDSAMCLPYNGPLEQEELDLCKHCYLFLAFYGIVRSKENYESKPKQILLLSTFAFFHHNTKSIGHMSFSEKTMRNSE